MSLPRNETRRGFDVFATARIWLTMRARPPPRPCAVGSFDVAFDFLLYTLQFAFPLMRAEFDAVFLHEPDHPVAVDEEYFRFLALRLFHSCACIESVRANDLVEGVILPNSVGFVLVLLNFLQKGGDIGNCGGAVRSCAGLGQRRNPGE